MILLFSCQTICQKSFLVLGRHPCVAMYVFRGGNNSSGGASDEAARGGAASRVANADDESCEVYLFEEINLLFH